MSSQIGRSHVADDVVKWFFGRSCLWERPLVLCGRLQRDGWRGGHGRRWRNVMIRGWCATTSRSGAHHLSLRPPAQKGSHRLSPPRTNRGGFFGRPHGTTRRTTRRAITGRLVHGTPLLQQVHLVVVRILLLLTRRGQDGGISTEWWW